jgi:hypothetical protein
MAFFMDPGAMFLGCLGPSEQKFLVTLIETAASPDIQGSLSHVPAPLQWRTWQYRMGLSRSRSRPATSI